MRLGPSPDRISQPFWLLTMLLGSGTLGIHVFAPALPLIAGDFRVDVAATQLTVSLYMFSLAIGQVVYGPISDRFGRRPVLIGGLIIYLCASLLAAVSSNLPMLLVARVLQAFGGCAGLVLGRAIVHDTFRGADAASKMAMLNAVLLLSPAVAPMIGIWLAEAFGWRSVPLLLTGIGMITLTATVLLLSETHGRHIEPIGELAGKYARLLRSPGFLAHVVGGSFTTTSLFTLLTTSPFIVTGYLGRPLGEVGYFYGALIAGIISGSVIASRFVRRIGFENLIIWASGISAAAGLAMVTLAVTGNLTVATFLLSGFTFTTMAGIMGPLALTKSVSATEDLKGTATGVYGFSQMLLGAICVMVASAGSNISISTAAVLGFCGCAGFTIFAASRIMGFRNRS